MNKPWQIALGDDGDGKRPSREVLEQFMKDLPPDQVKAWGLL
jgi:hypothetical protein